jgi:hypothetical protein
MKLISAFAVLSASLVLTSSPANSETFGHYECTFDCSGHEAGARWAEEHDITEAGECPYGNSNSFYEGCRAYAEGVTSEQKDEDKDEDEDEDKKMDEPDDDPPLSSN